MTPLEPIKDPKLQGLERKDMAVFLNAYERYEEMVRDQGLDIRPRPMKELLKDGQLYLTMEGLLQINL